MPDGAKLWQSDRCASIDRSSFHSSRLETLVFSDFFLVHSNFSFQRQIAGVVFVFAIIFCFIKEKEFLYLKAGIEEIFVLKFFADILVKLSSICRGHFAGNSPPPTKKMGGGGSETFLRQIEKLC